MKGALVFSILNTFYVDQLFLQDFFLTWSALKQKVMYKIYAF